MRIVSDKMIMIIWKMKEIENEVEIPNLHLKGIG